MLQAETLFRNTWTLTLLSSHGSKWASTISLLNGRNHTYCVSSDMILKLMHQRRAGQQSVGFSVGRVISKRSPFKLQ